MIFKSLTNRLNLTIISAILFVVPAAAHEIVIIPAPDCNGIYTDACGWGYYSPIGGWGRGGGSGGGGSSGTYDDGTTGTGNNFNRVTRDVFVKPYFYKRCNLWQTPGHQKESLL